MKRVIAGVATLAFTGWIVACGIALYDNIIDIGEATVTLLTVFGGGVL